MNKGPFGSEVPKWRSTIYFFAGVIVFTLFLCFFVGILFLIDKLLITDPSEYLVPVTLLCLLLILVGVSLWLLFCVLSLKTPQNKSWYTRIDPVEHLWLWILIVGLTGALFTYVAEKDYNEVLKTWETVKVYPNFLKGFLEKRSLTVFSVVMASLLADFVIVMLRRLRTYHFEIVESTEKLEAAKDMVVDASQKVEVGQKAVVNTLNDIAELKQELLIYLGAHEKQIKVMRQVNPLRDPIMITYKRHIAVLIDQVSSVYLKYVGGDRREKYLPTLLATTFINENMSQFGRVFPTQSNFTQANFGVMAKIVDSLYGKLDEIYKEYEKSNSSSSVKQNYKVVYFTTLTMPLNSYLKPVIWAGPVSSVISQWDDGRRKTRKTVYDRDDKVCPGHMWKFYIEPEKYEFRRCCLWLGKDVIIEKPRDAILTFKEWKAHLSEKPPTFKVYDNTEKLKDWFQNNQTPIDKDEERRYYDHPKYLDVLNDDRGFITPKDNPTPNVIKTFIDLYHPTAACCRYYEINLENTRELFIRHAQVINQAFPKSDILWDKLTKFMKNNNKESDPIYLDEDNHKYYWAEVFFNLHIPVDIFAIGVKTGLEKGGTEKCTWKGCLAGYVGGDFNSMILAWHDDVISKNIWDVIKVFLNKLYDAPELQNHPELVQEKLIERNDNARK